MKDSYRQQIFEACGRVKSAAETMKFLLHVHRQRAKDWPVEPQGSPRLWLEFSYSTLMEKTGYGRRQVIRAVSLLRKRCFVVLHQADGETNLYQVNIQAVERWLQRMPLFEQDQCHDQCHEDTSASVMKSPPPVSSWHGYQCHHDTSPPYMSLNSPSAAATGELADAAIIQQPEENPEAFQVDLSPGAKPESGSPDQAPDADRDEIIHQCQSIGISKEHAEAYIANNSRQKLKAALGCLEIQKRSRKINTEPGFVIGFLKDPAKYGYELDAQGCWRSSREIAGEKRRHAARARDRPVHDRRFAAAHAWDHLDRMTQIAIRKEIETTYPHESPALRLQRCHEAALARQQRNQPHDIHEEEASSQGQAGQSSSRSQPCGVQGAPR